MSIYSRVLFLQILDSQADKNWEPNNLFLCEGLVSFKQSAVIAYKSVSLVVVVQGKPVTITERIQKKKIVFKF